MHDALPSVRFVELPGNPYIIVDRVIGKPFAADVRDDHFAQEAAYEGARSDIVALVLLEEERDEFISVVSHELRTPITIVEGTLSNLDVMVGQKKAIDQKVLADSIKTAHDQVLYLARMVNDLSTLSRAERGIADAPEEIDVTELLHALHRKYQKEADK